MFFLLPLVEGICCTDNFWNMRNVPSRIITSYGFYQWTSPLWPQFALALSPDTRGWWAYFRKLGTEIRTRGPRLSGYRSLRRNAEIRACAEGRERIRSVLCARFPRPSTSVGVRAPHGYVLACLLPVVGACDR